MAHLGRLGTMAMDHNPLLLFGSLVKPWGKIFCTALEVHIAVFFGRGSLAMPSDSSHMFEGETAISL